MAVQDTFFLPSLVLNHEWKQIHEWNLESVATCNDLSKCRYFKLLYPETLFKGDHGFHWTQVRRSFFTFYLRMYFSYSGWVHFRFIQETSRSGDHSLSMALHCILGDMQIRQEGGGSYNFLYQICLCRAFLLTAYKSKSLWTIRKGKFGK